MEKKVSKEVNYYKYATFALLVIIVVFGLFYAFGAYRESVYNKGFASGQMSAVGLMIDGINRDGAISFTDGNATLTLVPSAQLQKVREGTILEIMNFVDKEGYVSLYNNETEVILMKYEPSDQNLLSLDAMMPEEEN